MIVTGLYPVWLFYTVGPLAAAVVAALLYRFIGTESAPTALSDRLTDNARTVFRLAKVALTQSRCSC